MSYNPQSLRNYLVCLGDDSLILGHRLSEWCGHAPILEEDIALANIALDCLGQANYFLNLAVSLEGGKYKSADSLVYFREAVEFRNLLLVELPNYDFGFSLVRQFIFDTYQNFLFEALSSSAHPELAALAAKSLKEVQYHLRHSSLWIVRLGDGTDESRERLTQALDVLWGYTGELFIVEEWEEELIAQKIAADKNSISLLWRNKIKQVLTEATLRMPDDNCYMHLGGRTGKHSEHLGHLLSELQIVARSYPEAKW